MSLCVQVTVHNSVKHKLLFSTYKPSTLRVGIPLNQREAYEVRIGIFLQVDFLKILWETILKGGVSNTGLVLFGK